MLWLPMRHVSARNQITSNLTNIVHHTAFSNEQNPYCIVSYKSPRDDKCKTIKARKLTPWFVYNENKDYKPTKDHRITGSWLRGRVIFAVSNHCLVYDSGVTVRVDAETLIKANINQYTHHVYKNQNISTHTTAS